MDLSAVLSLVGDYGLSGVTVLLLLTGFLVPKNVISDVRAALTIERERGDKLADINTELRSQLGEALETGGAFKHLIEEMRAFVKVSADGGVES